MTRRVRSAVSVLSHDTAVQSWEALGSLPCFANCHSMRSAAIPVFDLRSVCVTELEAYIGSSTCNMRNSVAARWPCQIFSFGIYFQLSNLQNCQFVTEDILWLLHSRQIGFCHQEKECPAQQRAWLLSKGDLNPIKEHAKQTMTLCSLRKQRRSFAEQGPVVLRGMLLSLHSSRE